MGAVTFSVDLRLVEALQQALPLDIFVETGTFKGDGIERVRDRFSEIRSVELSNDWHDRVRERFAGEAHVHLVQGHSAQVLTEWMPTLRHRSVLFFLDAHWCVADNTAGETSQCPLLDELHSIGSLNDESVIVIDDARLFLAPPPAPQRISHWPDLNAVLAALQALSPRHRTMVLNDTIVFFPAAAHRVLLDHARRSGTDWLEVMSQVRDYANLRTQFDQLRIQLEEKERLIRELDAACGERERRLREVTESHQRHLQAAAQATTRSEREQDLVAHMRRIECVNTAILKTIGALQINGQKACAGIEAAVATPCPGASLTLLQEICDARLKVIREQEAALASLRRTSLGYRLGQLRARHGYPKLGQLCHHEPIPLETWGLPPAKAHPPAESLPTVSIVTPSYGQAGFIAQTMDSVLNQGYPKLEYFVQDGGSDDGTVDILERYAPRLSGWESAPDNGQSQAINLGFAKTHGEIMAWLNSDDLLMPGTLFHVAAYFARHPEVDVVYGHRILIDEEGREIGRWILPRHDDAVLAWADFIPQETLFWRRRIWERAGGCIDETFRFAMDWDLLLRFRNAGARMKRLPCFLGAFRIHGAQKTSAAIHEVGMQEMQRLRTRELGRAVDYREIRRALLPYLLAHVGTDVLTRMKKRIAWR